MKILCVFGKYQYGDPSRGAGVEYSAFIPALKNLGHDVVHFDSWDRSKFSDFRLLNKALLETIEKEKPDILLSVQKNYEIWIETLEIIKKQTNVVTLCWTTDDSWKYREVSRFIGKFYHGMLTTYPHIIFRYHQDGIPNVLLSQWAADSMSMHEPISASDCMYQVSFVGASHGNRKRKIERLRKKGIHVSCFGFGWPEGAVNTDDIPRIMRNSVISLNFANSKGANQIKARTFEVPGAGGFLLTEGALGLEKYFTIEKDIDVFNDMDTLAKKIKYYLSHPDERDRIAKQGYEKTRMNHTYDVRMDQIIAFAKKTKKNVGFFNNTGIRIIEEDFGSKYPLPFPMKLLKKILTISCTAIWGEKRGLRASRRLVFEFSWRMFGEKTFSETGWPGRMFPEV